MKRKARCISLLLGIVFLLMFTYGYVFSAETYTHTWPPVQFETPIEFSKPIKLGMGAAALVHPPESELGKGRLEITLVEVPKDMQEGMGNDEAQIMAYVKSTYLGTAKPAEGVVERPFMGKPVKGERQKTTIPKPGELEIYLVTLSDGGKVAVGLSRDANVPAEEAEKVMEMMARTMKEAPGQ